MSAKIMKLAAASAAATFFTTAAAHAAATVIGVARVLLVDQSHQRCVSLLLLLGFALGIDGRTTHACQNALALDGDICLGLYPG